MTEKEISVEELEETVKRTDEQLDMMEWKMDNVEKQLVAPINTQDMCIMHLLKSVSEMHLYLSVTDRLELLDMELTSNLNFGSTIESKALTAAKKLEILHKVRSDYQQLRRELVEVQALQRELSSRLRTQLRLVHGKFARLRQRLAAASPPR